MEEKNELLDVDPEHYFRVANGTVIKSLAELDKALEAMGEETFRYHVNDYRNDFSSWIRDVIKDSMLADEILLTKDKQKIQTMVLRRVVRLLSKNG